jgi:hypothetical protein
MPTPPAHSDCITAALDALCRRAQVAPGDDSRSAGIAVAAVLQRDGMFVDTESDCPFAFWLTQASGLDEVPDAPRVIVGNVNVFLRMPRTGVTETIPMPLAVAAMVKVCLFKGSWRVPPMVAPRKRVRKGKPKGNRDAA